MASKTSPWVWVGIGCGAAVVGVVAFVAFIVFVVFASIRSATPYKDAITRAKSDPRVIAALGSPIEAGFWMTGSMKTENDSGSANITIPISGPKQSARIAIVGYKTAGRWSYTQMVVTPERGDPINLLVPPDAATGTAPQ